MSDRQEVANDFIEGIPLIGEDLTAEFSRALVIQTIVRAKAVRAARIEGGLDSVRELGKRPRKLRLSIKGTSRRRRKLGAGFSDFDDGSARRIFFDRGDAVFHRRR
jgi:hypothetical protein